MLVDMFLVLLCSKVLMLTRERETVTFSGVKEDCVPSVLRDFSAPVKLQFEQTEKDLFFLMAYDTDPVNKWRAAQKLAFSLIYPRVLLAAQDAQAAFEPLSPMFVEALKTVLLDEDTDNAVKVSLALFSFFVSYRLFAQLPQSVCENLRFTGTYSEAARATRVGTTF